MTVVNVKNEYKEISYFVEGRLKKYLDNVVRPSLEKKDKDWVLLIDGYEGAGKSTLGMQIGAYFDPTLNLNNVCFTAEEFKNSVVNAKKGQCVIYDEAVTGLSSADSIRKVGRILRSMMMQMRQKNLLVIIILPTIFDLNKYAVLSRTRGFLHVYELKGRRGYFALFNKKDTRMTYLLGKKTYTYKIRSPFTGRFYGKYPLDEDVYRKKKEEALFKVDYEEEDKKITALKNIRDNLIYKLYEKNGKNATKTYKETQDSGIHLSYMQITRIVNGKTLENIKK